MSKNILALLFESKAKTKLLKYIYQHPDESFSVKAIASRIQEPKDEVLREFEKLAEIGLVLKMNKKNNQNEKDTKE